MLAEEVEEEEAVMERMCMLQFVNPPQ